MTSVIQAIKCHHSELLNTLISRVAAVSENSPVGAQASDLVTFLKHELLPHALGEEEHMYPAVDTLVKTYGKATATMSVDHEFIENYICQIDQTVQALASAGGAERLELEITLRRLAVQLEAILRLHLEKEERIYLPLFERYLPEAQQQRILDGMHDAYEPTQQEALATIDVRKIPPPQRHPAIFQTFWALKPGQAFELINDHDPKPLYYQFKAEQNSTFTWDYLEQGPQIWRVRIGKVS
jgi:uncharacterized protein (DUF2249 family)